MYSPLVKYLARPLAYLAPFIEISIMFMGMKVMDRIEARILMNSRNGKPRASEYEPDPYLWDREHLPLLKVSRIEAFLRRETVSPEFGLHLAAELGAAASSPEEGD